MVEADTASATARSRISFRTEHIVACRFEKGVRDSGGFKERWYLLRRINWGARWVTLNSSIPPETARGWRSVPMQQDNPHRRAHNTQWVRKVQTNEATQAFEMNDAASLEHFCPSIEF
jgi:hypothetical protein